MKKILILSALLTFMIGSVNAEVIGIVDFDKVVDNYTKVKVTFYENEQLIDELEWNNPNPIVEQRNKLIKEK